MRLAHRERDGSSLRQHLQAAARGAPDLADPMLTATSVPPACRLLWEAYIELDASRPAGMGGACAIPQTEIQAWQANHGLRLSPWELSTLAAMDRAALSVAAEAAQRDRSTRKPT